MGKRLKALNVGPNLIVSSPAKRAITTARLIAEAIGYDRDEIVEDDVLYSAFPEDTLKIIQTTPDSAESVMIFGHNPTMTDLVNRLSDFSVDNVATCGAFCARFDVEEWAEVAEGEGEFVFFEYPKLVG
jgi:phosphohistidine phosphatase